MHLQVVVETTEDGNMPISKINQDGTVEIFNSKTNQRKNVRPEELASYNPALLKQYNEYNKANIELQGGGAKVDPKTKSSLDATNNLVASLEQRFQESKGGEYSGVGARLSGAQKSIMAMLGLNDPAKTYEDQRAGFAATLKQLTGDTGVLTDQDFARLSKLIPSLGATKGEAENKFNDLRSQIAAKYQGEKTTTKYQAPESKGGLLALLAPNLAAGGKTLANYPQSLIQAGGEIAQKGVLGAPSPELRANLTPGGNTQGYTGNRLIDSLIGAQQATSTAQGAAGEVATPFFAAKAIKSGTQKLGGLTVKGALENRVAATEKVAGAGTKFSGKELYGKAEETALKSASETDLPKVKKLLEIIKPALQKSRTPQEAVEKLAGYNKAYSAAGRVGKTAKAVVDDALSKATRGIFEVQAPDLAAAQSQLARAMKLKKFSEGVGRQVLGTGVGVGAAGLIGLLLGRRQSQ